MKKLQLIVMSGALLMMSACSVRVNDGGSGPSTSNPDILGYWNQDGPVYGDDEAVSRSFDFESNGDVEYCLYNYDRTLDDKWELGKRECDDYLWERPARDIYVIKSRNSDYDFEDKFGRAYDMEVGTTRMDVKSIGMAFCGNYSRIDGGEWEDCITGRYTVEFVSDGSIYVDGKIDANSEWDADSDGTFYWGDIDNGTSIEQNWEIFNGVLYIYSLADWQRFYKD